MPVIVWCSYRNILRLTSRDVAFCVSRSVLRPAPFDVIISHYHVTSSLFITISAGLTSNWSADCLCDIRFQTVDRWLTDDALGQVSFSFIIYISYSLSWNWELDASNLQVLFKSTDVSVERLTNSLTAYHSMPIAQLVCTLCFFSLAQTTPFDFCL